MKKKTPWPIKILLLLFIGFIGLYIASISGYYEQEVGKKTIITEEKLEEFEEDVKEGKEIDIKNYVTNETVDYSSSVSKMGIKIATGLDKLLGDKIPELFKVLGSLF